MDGVVVGGHSFVDQATITGESMPAEKSKGHRYMPERSISLARSKSELTGSGAILHSAKSLTRWNGRKNHARPFKESPDRLAGYLVYFALGAAALTFLITHNVRSTISVVIVAGACGIAAGTPLAILGAIGRSAQHGSIIKGGLYLESLATIDTILLDKTGTLTYGTPEVVDVHSAEGVPAASLLQAAVTAESRSEHPVGEGHSEKRRQTWGSPVEEPDKFRVHPWQGNRRGLQRC